jgi:phage terminase Nu1 subunit (DNA packaging protein)
MTALPTISAWSRQGAVWRDRGGGRKDRTRVVLPSSIPISTASLRPVDAFDMPSTWPGGGASRAFDSLLDVLIRHFAASMPDRHDDAGDDEDDTEELGNSRKRGSSPAR